LLYPGYNATQLYMYSSDNFVYSLSYVFNPNCMKKCRWVQTNVTSGKRKVPQMFPFEETISLADLEE